MKRIFFIAALVSLASPFICCKSKKNTTKSSDSLSTSSETVTAKFRVIVSFISKGAGTDGDLRTNFTKFVESHPKKPAFTVVHWGREGEADYCFLLKELSEKEQIAFMKDIQNLIGKTDMVFINENTESHHKR